MKSQNFIQSLGVKAMTRENSHFDYALNGKL